MLVHQSTLAAWSRCPAEVGYQRAGVPSQTNSAAAYGSVIHHVLQGLERSLHEGRMKYGVRSAKFAAHHHDAVQVALESFAWGWNPNNIATITDPVPADGWLPRQGYAELRARGLDSIRKYADLIKFDDHELLALEYGFVVPIDGTWDYELEQPHLLGGSVDRLAARHFSRQLACCVDDYKCTSWDTPVLMADGTERPASEVLVGDLVVAWDSGNFFASSVIRSADNGIRPTVRVSTVTTSQVVTTDHPFLVADPDRWVMANDLDFEDHLELVPDWRPDEWFQPPIRREPVLSVTATGQRPTWALTVAAGTHITAGVVTHNTGKEQAYLRYNVQFSAYCYASTKKEFWVGWGGEDGFGPERGEELYQRFQGKGRRGTWINMRTFKYQDAGWRAAKDYQRLALAVDQICSSIQADIFPLTVSGSACTWCDYRRTCGGTGLPAEDDGDPRLSRR